MVETYRIVFNGLNDVSFGYYITMIEERIRALYDSNDFDIIDFMETINIKSYFNNGVSYTKWTTEIETNLKHMTEFKYTEYLKSFLSLSPIDLTEMAKELDLIYYNDFWKEINDKYKLSLLKNDFFDTLINFDPKHLHYVIRFEKITKRFNNILIDHVIKSERGAELILDDIAVSSLGSKNQTKSKLSIDKGQMREILKKYIQCNDPNMNYLRIIFFARSYDNDIRTLAKAKYEEIRNTFSYEENIFKLYVKFSETQDEEVIIKKDSEETTYSYSLKFLDSLNNDIHLIYMCKYLFVFLNEVSILTLSCFKHDINIFEKIAIRSEDEYFVSSNFQFKQFLSITQLKMLNSYLNQRENSIENLINSFIEYLNQLIHPDEFDIMRLSSLNSYEEKILIVLPIFERLLKIYKSYSSSSTTKIEHRYISSPINFSEVSCLKKHKYFYLKQDTVYDYFLNCLFSDQGALYYLPGRSKQENCLFDLLSKNNVQLHQFKNFQIDVIQDLLNKGFLIEDSNRFIKLTDEDFGCVLIDLFRYEVIHYWHYTIEQRNYIDKLFKEGYIDFEESLLSRDEVKYFNYILNTKSFTNSLELRNKYIHGDYARDENRIEADYYQVLILLIVTLFKIHDDLASIEDN